MRHLEVGLAILKKHSLKANEIFGNSALDANATVTDKVLTVDTLLEPIAPEEIGLVRCLGLNYKDHAVRTLRAVLRTQHLQFPTRLSLRWPFQSTSLVRVAYR